MLRKMMAKDPRHRHASPAELVADLLALAEQIGLRPMSPASRVWLTPPRIGVVVSPAFAVDGAGGGVGLHRVAAGRFSRPRETTCCRRCDSAEAEEVIEQVAEHPSPPRRNDRPKTRQPARSLIGNAAWRRGAGETAAAPPASTNAVAFATDVRSETRRPDVPPSEPDKPVAHRREAIRRADRQRNADRRQRVFQPWRGLRRRTQRRRYRTAIQRPAGRTADENLESATDGSRRARVIIRSSSFVPRKSIPSNILAACSPFPPAGLTMTDVAVELDVPRDVPTDNWSLFETWGGQTVRLERCSLTVRNASDQLTTYHQEVAFVRARPAPDAGVAVESAAAATPLATIELTDCIARGEAVFLLRGRPSAGQLAWDNGLLVDHRAIVVRRRRPDGPEAGRNVASRTSASDGRRPRRTLPVDQHARPTRTN